MPILVFFFQAEDGIRDFCLSRGLGDVYKRQVIVSDVAVCSASYFYRHFVLRMQAVESHLFDEAFICRAYVAELLVVSGVCVVRVACAFIAAVMLAVLDVDSVTELPHVAEPVLDP